MTAFLRRLEHDRLVRRLLLAVLWLAAIDQAVPRALRQLEYSRYEAGRFFRFANSDVFALAPLVAYLREHPKGERPRRAFFGDSMIFGYLLDEADSIPAEYQTLVPSDRVLSFAINGFPIEASYLTAKAVVDTVDTLFVLLSAHRADNASELSRVARLIPVASDDIVAFDLPAPDETERRLAVIASRWRLYSASYRLQAAMFGASSRHYIRGLMARSHTRVVRGQGAAAGPRVNMSVPAASTPPTAERIVALRTRHPLLWKFGDLIAAHGKRGVLFQVAGRSEPVPESELADFNAVFGPRVTVVTLRIPSQLTYDGMHLTPAGARSFAEALRELTSRQQMP
jgi:hypothetical protein